MKKIYCEIMTEEEVMMLDETMTKLGIDSMCRPSRWAARKPSWYKEHRERTANEDPLAVVEIVVDDSSVIIDSAYRFVEDGYTQVSPETMNTILAAMYLYGKNKHKQ